MNYITIVYNAFITEGKFVSDYFISECKKAERDEFITPEMYFAGCLSVCNDLKNEIKKTFYRLKKCIQCDEQGNEIPFNIDEISYPFNDIQVDNNRIDFVINMIEISKIELIDLPDVMKKMAEKIESNQTPPPAPAKFSGSKLLGIYNPDKVYKEFKKELSCSYDTFKSWFVDSVICDKKMSWKYGNGNGNKAQLMKFIFVSCGGWEPAEIKTAFIVEVDSNNNRSKELNPILQQRLEKCKFD